MKLQKLLVAGAFTVTGDVLWTHPTRGQLKIASWTGGDECELTPLGDELLDDILAEKKPARRAAKAEPAGE